MKSKKQIESVKTLITIKTAKILLRDLSNFDYQYITQRFPK